MLFIICLIAYITLIIKGLNKLSKEESDEYSFDMEPSEPTFSELQPIEEKVKYIEEKPKQEHTAIKEIKLW